MAGRSIASLSISFGLVSIPIRLFSATEAASAVRFKLMGRGGTRLRQQYVSDEPLVDEPAPVPEPEEQPAAPVMAEKRASSGAAERVIDFPRSTVAIARSSAEAVAEPEPGPVTVERSDMVKGYEFEKGKFVLFTADELKALESESRQTIDIVSFIPASSVDPIYYDKAYYLAPDKRGGKPYQLLLQAMQKTGKVALGKWAWRSKEFVVQIRPTDGGMVLQQLLYADEVRSIAELGIEATAISAAELQLAEQLIGQISAEGYDPTSFVDEEKQRILAAVEKKIAGQAIVAPAHRDAPAGSGQVLDLVAALKASLASKAPAVEESVSELGKRKPARRATADISKAPATKRKA